MGHFGAQRYKWLAFAEFSLQYAGTTARATPPEATQTRKDESLSI
jgi:hypothetical protein